MTARRILWRLLLAALLCALLVSAALAADSPDDAVEKLKTAVENRADSVTVSFLLSESYDGHISAMQAYILSREDWVDVSPRLSITNYVGVSENDAAITVKLRYAEKTGDYDAALEAAYASCIRDSMTDLEQAASIYSWLADTVKTTTCIFDYKADEWQNIAYCGTAYETLVDKQADCFGFAAAFRAIAKKAGLECVLVKGTYNSKEHAWNAVRIGDAERSAWYYVDASRGDSDWTPGHADYNYLLFGTNKSGYSATIEDENITISSEAYKDDSLGFSRREVPAPLMLTDDGFWLIRHMNNITALYLAPYGTNFQMEPLAAIIPNSSSMMLYAAAAVDGVIYYSRSFPSDDRRTYALYSFVPGAGKLWRCGRPV